MNKIYICNYYTILQVTVSYINLNGLTFKIIARATKYTLRIII